MKYAPNALSFFRLLLCVPLPYLASQNAWGMCLMLIALGYLSDLLDGPIARRYNTVSEYGKQLDLLADVVFDWAIVAGVARLLPVWFTAGLCVAILLLRLPAFIPSFYKAGTVAMLFWYCGMTWAISIYVLQGFGMEGLKKALMFAIPAIAIIAWLKRARIKSDIQKMKEEFGK